MLDFAMRAFLSICAGAAFANAFNWYIAFPLAAMNGWYLSKGMKFS